MAASRENVASPKTRQQQKKCHADVATKMERGGSVSPIHYIECLWYYEY